MLQRHDLVRVRPDGWLRVLSRAPCFVALDGEARRRVVGWADDGWPVIVRRRAPGDGGRDVGVGLPLPPSCGKLRVALSIPPELVAETLPAVTLDDAVGSVPAGWLAQIDALLTLGKRLALQPALYGSLLWQHLTGLDYLQAGSDIDLIWRSPTPATLKVLLDGLARLDDLGPAKLDGEIVLASGGAVNWRELRQELQVSGGAVLVKSMDGAEIRCAQTLFV